MKNKRSSNFSNYTVNQVNDDSLKQNALRVLENNCNECHSEKKPSYYFTEKTMDYFAAAINIEVFVTGKMPKGRKNELSIEDSETLRIWLEMKLKKRVEK